ncbi:TPA: hypothetical protein SB263_001856 [Campylobacter coli]|nr:hypothetical protein [Campylobacter coli]
MILNTNADILVTHSFHFNNTKMHGLSGHLFEVLDYYWYFKNKGVNVKCLIPEIVTKETFNDFIKGHYSVDFDLNDMYFLDTKILAIKARNILVTDGGYWFLNQYKSKLLGKVFSFACGPSFLESGDKPEYVTFLADHKIYPGLGINYTKKVLPYLNHIPGDKPFAHVTKNCRALSESQIKDLIRDYPDIVMYSDYLNIQNSTNKPIKNFNFSKYVYTPIMRHFDCSPRLIIECRILGIDFDLWDINYKDPGLERRLEADLDQFILNDSDTIINYLV